MAVERFDRGDYSGAQSIFEVTYTDEIQSFYPGSVLMTSCSLL